MIQQLINEALLAKQAERSKRERSGKFSPSMFGRCYRAQIWDRKNEEVTNPPDERALRVFAVGNIFHDWIQSYLPKHDCEVLIETEDIKGYADIVFDDCVTDLKTMHSKGFWWMAKSNYDMKKEKLPNILQVCAYAWLLNKPKASLCFISKDDLCINEYPLDVKEWIPAVELELKALRYFWAEAKLPPALPRCYMQVDGTSKECGYCSFSIGGKCKKGDFVFCDICGLPLIIDGECARKHKRTTLRQNIGKYSGNSEKVKGGYENS